MFKKEKLWYYTNKYLHLRAQGKHRTHASEQLVELLASLEHREEDGLQERNELDFQQKHEQ